MTRFADTAVAACAAFVPSLSSISAIVTAPPAQAAAPAAFATAELA